MEAFYTIIIIFGSFLVAEKAYENPAETQEARRIACLYEGCSCGECPCDGCVSFGALLVPESE